MRIAAARELFEETGVWLGAPLENATSKRRAPARRRASRSRRCSTNRRSISSSSSGPRTGSRRSACRSASTPIFFCAEVRPRRRRHGGERRSGRRRAGSRPTRRSTNAADGLSDAQESRGAARLRLRRRADRLAPRREDPSRSSRCSSTERPCCLRCMTSAPSPRRIPARSRSTARGRISSATRAVIDPGPAIDSHVEAIRAAMPRLDDDPHHAPPRRSRARRGAAEARDRRARSSRRATCSTRRIDSASAAANVRSRRGSK